MLETRHAARRSLPLDADLMSAASEPMGSVAIRPLLPEARFSLRLDPAEGTALGTICDFKLDIPINSRSARGARSVARLGPSEWFLLGPGGEAEAIAEHLRTALEGRAHALVDIGHRNVAIEVCGPRAPDVLNSGCPLDLANRAFPTGSATRTMMGKAEILLMRLDDAPTYRVECWRSFSRYVHDFLVEAAREFVPAAR